MNYKPTIGLEVHAELATESKMFCGCKNSPHETDPNTYVCPVCLAHPGSLPVANKQAIAFVLQFGAAVGATQATYSEFNRKNYFYPDIPKAYQISQYAFPFLAGGSLLDVELTRVHLEEDTARSSHEHVDGSLVDFNRAGVPLMELVTEPVIHDAATAGAFARELQLVLQTIGISHANMERGEMRIEVNISLSASEDLGTKVEVKNINSFKAVEAAIAYEIERQSKILDEGGSVTQETRGWDENKQKTVSQRSKETAKDYRYFPDPDLPQMQLDKIAEFSPQKIHENLPELPEKKRDIYSKIGISRNNIEIIIANQSLDAFFAAMITHVQLTKTEHSDELLILASNYLCVDLYGLHQAGTVDIDSLDPAMYTELMLLNQAGTIGSRATKDLLPLISTISGSLEDYAKEKGLLQMTDTNSLQTVVLQIIEENPEQVQEFRAGKETVLKYLLGQGMKATKGSADPKLLEQLLVSEITK